MRVAVVGAGPAGLCSALVLSRAGHEVVLFERDPFEDGSPADAFGWQRNGIPHFAQPHAFIPRGRAEMLSSLPDLYRDLLDQGALEIPFGDHLPGGAVPEHEDEELTYLAVRRQLIEWVLRRAIRRDSLVDVMSAARVTGLLVEPGDVPRVRGLSTDVGECRVELVVDAGGRRSSLPGWLREAGADLPANTSQVGLLYYSRYYRMLPGQDLPLGGASLGPRGDLGYCSFACFPGDNATFGFVLMPPVSQSQFRILRSAAAFQAFCLEIPQLGTWVDPAVSQPVTDVMPMGGLQNTLVTWIRDHRPAVVGAVPVSDAWIHTDPTLALGLSNSLIHARALAAALAEHSSDLGDAALAYFAGITCEAEERYELATALSDARHRRWVGDMSMSPEANLPFYLMIAGPAAAMHDVEVFRMVWRRNGFLDSTAVLEKDTRLIKRIEQIFAEKPPPRPEVPERDALLAHLTAAAATET